MFGRTTKINFEATIRLLDTQTKTFLGRNTKIIFEATIRLLDTPKVISATEYQN